MNTTSLSEVLATRKAAGVQRQAQAGRQKRVNKTSVMLRIDPDLLDAIGQQAKAAGLTRSAWMHTTLTKAVVGKG